MGYRNKDYAIGPGCNEVDRDTRMRVLSEQLNKPGGLKERAARILLSEFQVGELGNALYMRCRRAVRRASSARYKVMGNKPGRPNKEQRQELDFHAAVRSLHKVIEEIDLDNIGGL